MSDEATSLVRVASTRACALHGCALHAHCLQASTALWLDADVVMLRNPWAVITPTPLWGADSHAAAHAWTHDIRYQAEQVPPAHGNLSGVGGAPEWRRGETNACPPLALTLGVNGGQLLVHSAAFAQDMDRHRPPKLSNADFLDQDFANRLLVRGGYSRCPLPASRRLAADPARPCAAQDTKNPDVFVMAELKGLVGGHISVRRSLVAQRVHTA